MGTGVAPKSFLPPQAIGSSGNANLVSEAQAAPQLAQQNFLPLSPPPDAQTPATPQTQVDPNADDPITAALKNARNGKNYLDNGESGRMAMFGY